MCFPSHSRSSKSATHPPCVSSETAAAHLFFIKLHESCCSEPVPEMVSDRYGAGPKLVAVDHGIRKLTVCLHILCKGRDMD